MTVEDVKKVSGGERKLRLAKSYSGTVSGVVARTVEIEVCSAGGSPQFTIVGLPDAAVKEAKDRVSTAIANSRFAKIESNITVNLAPADVRKEGPIYDLPIAVTLLAAYGKLRCPDLSEFGLVGELALSGEVRHVRGVLAIVLEMRRIGRKGVLVPAANAAEASVVQGIDVFPVRTLREAVEFLQGELVIEPCRTDIEGLLASDTDCGEDFADVKGQETAKDAVEIAVAGGHNLLFIGPPGSGKSMLAKRVPSILPALTPAEALEVTRILSVAGKLETGMSLATRRPFRAPHHTTSPIALVGGGTHPQPGEVSLAHRGVLFLDEMPEFSRGALEILRQPLEDGHVVVSRAAGSCDYPGNFMLVAAMNPCPCGYFGDMTHECRCSPRKRAEYLNRISGPLLDRIDLHVEVPAVPVAELGSLPAGRSSAEMRARVLAARRIQRRRFADIPGVHCNAEMRPKELSRFCRLDDAGHDEMKIMIERLDLSARAYDRILKVARTVADLDGRENISRNDVMIASMFRALDKSYWI